MTQANLRRGQGTILVVDDEDLLRSMLENMLQRLGYGVKLAANGLEALQRYEEAGGGIDLVLLDMSMPQMSGLECAAGLRRLDPGVRIILITGYSEASLRDGVRESHIRGFLQKPFRLQELSERVAECIKAG